MALLGAAPPTPNYWARRQRGCHSLRWPLSWRCRRLEWLPPEVRVLRSGPWAGAKAAGCEMQLMGLAQHGGVFMGRDEMFHGLWGCGAMPRMRASVLRLLLPSAWPGLCLRAWCWQGSPRARGWCIVVRCALSKCVISNYRMLSPLSEGLPKRPIF